MYFYVSISECGYFCWYKFIDTVIVIKLFERIEFLCVYFVSGCDYCCVEVFSCDEYCLYVCVC